MPSETDTGEGLLYKGNITVIPSDNIDSGSGNIEVYGSLYTDNLSENTTNAGITIPLTYASTSSIIGSLKLSGGISISNTTDSTSSINGGTITTAGGIAIGKTLYIGGTTASTSNTTGSLLLIGGLGVNNTIDATSSTNGGSITTAGGLAIGKTLYIGGTTTTTSNITGSLILVGGIGLNNTTDATSSTNGGTITTAGGAAIAKRLYIGGTTASTNSTTGTLLLSGGLSISITTEASSSTNGGSITTAGGVAIAKSLYVGSTTASTTSATGGLIISGGLGISNTTDSTSNTNGGSLTTAGGVSIAKSLFVGGTTTSTSSTTGAVVLTGGLSIANTTDAASSTNGGTITTAGGVAIAKNLYVGSSIANTSTTTIISTSINTLSATSGAITTTGDIQLYGATPLIAFRAISLNTPTLTTRSTGTKIVLYSTISGTDVDHAIGIASFTIWFSIPNTSASYKYIWYGNTTNIMQLNAQEGSLVLSSTVASTSNSTGIFRCAGGIGLSNTTDAVSSTNGGTITTAGGVAIAKSLYVGGTTTSTSSTSGAVVLTGGLSLSNTTDAVSSTNGGTITTAGGVAIAKSLYVGGTTTSTSSTSGAVVLTGGLSLSNTTDAVSSTNGGTITTAGGVAIAKSLYVGGTTTSTSSTSGAVVLTGGLSLSNTTDAVSSTNGGTITTAGGVAIAKSLYVGTSLAVAGSIVFRTPGGAIFWQATQSSNNPTIQIGSSSASTATTRYTSSTTSTQSIFFNDTTTDQGSIQYNQNSNFMNFTVETINVLRLNTSDINMPYTTATTSSTTGSLLLSGGLAINNTTDAVSSTNGGTITTAGGLAVAKSLYVGTNFNLLPITAPSNPASGIRLYIDTSDSLLKSKNTSGTVTTYNPNTTKGDILTHDGTTQTRLPVGNDNEILVADSTESTGLIYKPLTASATASLNSYLNIGINTATTITTSYTDIIIDNSEFIDNSIFQINSQDIEITFLTSGTYYIKSTPSYQLSTDAGSAVVTTRILLDTGGGFNEIPGSLSSCNLITGTGPVDLNMCCSFITLNLSANNKIKLQAIKTSGALSTVQTNINTTTLLISKITVDANDNSTYYNGYNTTNTTLVGGFTDLPITKRFTDADYTHTNGTASVTVNSTAKYIITANVTVEKTATAATALASFQIVINGAAQTDTLRYIYINSNTINLSSSATEKIVSLTSGDIVKIQVNQVSGANLRTYINGCSLCINKYSSSVSNQTIPLYYDVYNTTVTSIPTSYTDIPLNVENIKESIYTHTANSAVTTVTEAGFYILEGHVTVVNSAGTIGGVSAKFVLDYGGVSGYVDIVSSIGYSVYGSSGNGPNTSIYITSLRLLSNNTNIKLQAIKSSSTGTISTVANLSKLIITKIQPPYVLQKSASIFGNYFSSRQQTIATTTSSASFVTKIILVTNYLASGNYHIGMSYRNVTNAANRDMGVRLLLNNITELHLSEVSLARAANKVTTSDFIVSNLSEGIQQLNLQFRSIGGSAVIIDNCKIEIYRVS